MAYKSGQMIAQRYRIIRTLAASGLFTSYLAEDILLSRSCIVEISDEQAVDGPSESERFAREIRLIAMLAHPNIVPVLEYSKALYSNTLSREGSLSQIYLAGKHRGEL